MKWTNVLAIIVWVASVLGLLKIVEITKLQLFDPQQKLLMHSMKSSFELNFTERLQVHSGQLTKTVVHFRTGKCICENLVESHSDELASNLSASGYKNLTVDLADLPDMTRYIPSTPAVAVFNESHQLLYLGPYSVGLGCFTDNSLINTITRYTLTRYLGAHINADVEGCYCPT